MCCSDCLGVCPLMAQYIHRPPQRNPTFTVHARCCVPPSRGKGQTDPPAEEGSGSSIDLQQRPEVLFRGGARSVFVAPPSHTSSREDEVQPVVAETMRHPPQAWSLIEPVGPGRDAHR